MLLTQINDNKICSRQAADLISSKRYQSKKLMDEVLDYFILHNSQLLSNMHKGSPLENRGRVLKLAREQFLKKGIKDGQLNTILDEFSTYLWGYYVLEPLISNQDISDIKCYSHNHIRIKECGVRKTSNIKFLNEKDYRQFVQLIAVKNRTNLSDLNAVQTFTDKDSNTDFILRFTITTEFINSVSCPYVHIRKISKKKYRLAELIAIGMLDVKQAVYLKKMAADSGGILFTGKGASGKTTLMNTLIEEIPHNKSGLFIQENEELFTYSPELGGHPDMMFEHIVQNRGEGKINYTLSSLTRAGLLQDLDYIGIGEIKGDEAADFMKASYTGQQCWATVHGKNSTEAIYKLADYIKQAVHYELDECLRMITGIETVVFMKNFKVEEISEIKGFDEENKKLIIDRIF